MTIFSKARAFTLGNIHDILDKTIDLNSPAVLKQHVRDLESAMDQLKAEAVIQAGAVRTINREVDELQHNITVKTAAVKSRMSSPNVTSSDSVVRSWASQVTNWQKELADKQTQLPAQQKVVADLDAAIAKLEVKHTEAVSNVRRLVSSVHSADAKNRAADALGQAAKMSSGMDGESIDNLQARVQSKVDVADEKFERAIGSDTFAESAEQSADVDNFLNSLK